MSTNIVDCKLRLTEQNLTLEYHQRQHRCKILSSEKDSVQIQNIAESQELPLGADIPALTLVDMPAGRNPTTVQPTNTTLTFDNVVFVNSMAIRVAGFHSA